MKNILLFIAVVIALSSQLASAQCSFNNFFWTDLTPAGPGLTATEPDAYGGDLYTVSVVAGETYVFSTCNSDWLGGFDTQLTLYDNTGTIVLGYDDDACAPFSSITWVATYTGVVNLLLDEYNCSNTGGGSIFGPTVVDVTWVGPPVCTGLPLEPICTSVGLNYPAGVTGTDATLTDPANAWDCLSSAPDAEFFYFEIATAGNINMTLSGSSDVDFIIWGPFSDLAAAESYCGQWGFGGLSGNIVDCSFDPAATEYPVITGAQVGEVYVMIITNFSGLPQNLTLTQTGGTGSTDCSIVSCGADAGTYTVTMSNPTANNYALCVGDNISAVADGNAVLPSSADIAGVGYAIYACTPTTGDPDTDPCWTGYYWTGGNYSDANIPGNVYEFILANPIPGYAAVSGNTYCIAPITMDDIATIAAGGADDNLGHDVDGDLCFDLGAAICIDYLPQITFAVTETCAPNTVTITISGGYPDVNGGSSYTVTNTGAGTMNQSGANGEIITITGYTTGAVVSIDVTNDGNTCTGTFSYNTVCAGCSASVGTFTVTENGVAGTSPLYLCTSGGGDCFSVTSNNDYVLPPSVPGEQAELMYAIYTCPPGPSPDPSLDPCYSGLLWTGQDISDCNNATSIFLGAGLGPDVYLVPITMDDGDNGANPNGVINWDNSGDGCWAIGAPIEIVFLEEITASISENCDDIVITLSGGYPGFTGTDSYVVTNTGAGTLSQSGANGEIITLTGYTPGQTISFDVADGHSCIASVSHVANNMYSTVSLNGITNTICTSPTGAVDISVSGYMCTYTINMYDSWGDGWDGAFLSVTADGVPVAGSPFTVSAAQTFFNSVTFSVNAGQTVNFNYTAGAWENEHSYEIVQNGAIIFSDGPNPGTGLVYSTSCPGYTYLWSNGAITQDLTNVPAGSYSVQVTNGAGCVTNAGPYDVLAPNTPTALISPDPATVCAGQNLSLNGNPAGGTGVYTTHAWTGPGAGSLVNPNVVNPTFSNGTAGTYDLTYTVTDNNGCVGTDNITVTVNANPTAAIAPDPAAVCAGQNLSLNGTPAGGSGTYTTHAWTGAGAGSLNDPAVVSPTFNNGTAGTYALTYTVTDNNGCVGTDNITVFVNANPTAAIAPDPAAVCAGQNLSLNGTPAGGSGTYTTHAWTGAGSGSLTNPGVVSPTFNNGTAGTYALTYTVTDNNGCVGTDNITVTVNANPTAAIAPDPAAVCAGQNLSLNGTPAGGSGTYTTHAWTGAGSGSLTNPGDVSPTFNNGTAGTYALTYTVTDNNGCVGTDNITVTVNANPTAAIAPDPAAVCAGQNLSLNGTPAGGSGTYTTHAWTGAGAGSLNDPAVVSPTFNNGTAGTYALTYTVTDNNGCVGTDNITVTVNANPIAAIAPDPAAVCSGTDLIMNGTPSGGSGTYTTHAWTGTGSGSLNDPALVGPTFNNATAGAYDLTYTVTDNNGCFGTDNITVTVYATPAIDPLGPITACDSYTLPAITGTDVTVNAAYYDDTQANGGQVVTGPITQSGTYYMYDGANGCSDEEAVVITINALPTVTTFTGEGNYCAGEVVNDLIVTVTGTANYTLDYTVDGVAQTANATSSPINLGNAPGVYVLTGIQDANCTNTASGTQTIVVNAVPGAPTVTPDTTYCLGNDYQPMVATGSGGTFTWFGDSGLSTTVGTGASLTPAETTGSVTYYVTETSAAGCEGPSSMVTITINPCEIIVPTAFTPGQEPNTMWEILYIDEVYPNNIVMIYNRWGNLIYEHASDPSNPYSLNPWDGTNQANGEPLPVASYYYVIQFNNGTDEGLKGTVTIIK